ncbi:caspase, EACC1-associated type [Kribbella catacumbae]|uniref:caspase, EACC1-associated type n=1 Tax=Kribbella catacumbae TaxID=460086 RepID=UPI00035FB719|nr:caspase family protein [Kribbella catacumbae]
MGRRLALLIATYEYEDTGLRRLTTPAHDAEALATVLEDPEIAGFEVRTLVNAPTHEVGEAIAEFYGESRRDDLTLLYFTGHGLKDDNGRLHLAMSNTKRDRLRFTALSAQLVDEAMADSLSRQKILILDCCYSGSYETQQFAKSDSAVHTLEKLGGRGRTVLTASDSTQYAFEGSTIHGEAAQSVFTRHLVDGLRDGTADLDGDGDITVDELYNFVYDRVTAEQPNQRPKKLDQVEGRTIIAANVNWTLPRHLAEAVVSPLPGAREAAVGQLAQLRWSGNDLVRRTANSRLEQLLEDDSRAVSAAARAALDAPAPPLPIATPSPRPTRQRTWAEPTNVTIGAVLGESVSRWVSRGMSLIPATVPWPISILSLVAALALVGAVVAGFAENNWSTRIAWYLVAAAVVLCASVVLQRRLGVALAAGTAAFGVLGALLLVGLSWHQLWIVQGAELRSLPIVASFAGVGHAAWIGAGMASLWQLRRAGELRVDVRRLRGRRVWLVIALGGIGALAQLVIQYSVSYESRLDFQWRRFYPVALTIISTELAIAGPLIAVLMKQGRAFLGGWVLAGVAGLIGIYRDVAGFGLPTMAVVVLFAAWVSLGVLAVVGWRDEVAVERDEAAVESVKKPARRWLAGIGAGFALPVVLSGAVIVVDPQGPLTPVVIALTVGPNNDVLYAADSGNDEILRINTNSQHTEGEALKVGKDPLGLVLAPDGRRLYVANTRSNSVSVIDVDNWKVLGAPIPVGPEPIDLALSPETKRLFVLSSKAATITVVDTEKLATVGGPVSSGDTPSSLIVGQGGKRLYVASRESSTVAVLDAETMRPARSPYKITGQPIDLSITRDNYLYVLSAGSYSVVNTNVESPRPAPVPLSGGSRDAALTDDGSRYVVLSARSDGQRFTDMITVIDTKAREVIGTAESDGGVAIRVEVSHDNQRIYAGGYNYEHDVLIVDATIPKVIGGIQVER